MQFTATTALLAVLIPLASATCAKNAPANVGVNVKFGLDSIPSTAKLLQGDLDGGQLRSICVTDTSNGSNWLFSIKNNKKDKKGATVKLDDITKNLTGEIHGCHNKGGSSTYDGIQFNAFPESGVCIDANYINNQNPPSVRALRRGRPVRRAGFSFVDPVTGIKFTDVSDRQSS